MTRLLTSSPLSPYTTLFRSTVKQHVTHQKSIFTLDLDRSFFVDDLSQFAKGYIGAGGRSEEHTSELQSRGHLVCRLLLEEKKRLNRLVLNIALVIPSSDRLV